MKHFQSKPKIGEFTDEPMGMVVLKPRKGLFNSDGIIDDDVVLVDKIMSVYASFVDSPVKEDDINGMEITNSGLGEASEVGFKYYEISRVLSRETTHGRLAMDVITFPIVFTKLILLKFLFVHIFYASISGKPSLNCNQSGFVGNGAEETEHENDVRLDVDVKGYSNGLSGGGFYCDVGATTATTAGVMKIE